MFTWHDPSIQKGVTEPNYVCQVTVLRERLNLKQADLARRAGLTRQAINLIERGLTVPSVTTALRLAEVLNCSVSDLFQRSKEPQLLPVIVSQSIARSQQRVRLAEVNGVWVAVPCSTNDLSEYGEADGKLVSREGIHGVVDLINSPDSLKDNLIVSGCDPALAILRDLWRRGNHQGIVHWNNLSSGAALNALRSGEAHVIGVHFHDMASQRSALALLPMDVVVIRFARWEQGWMVPQGNPQHFKGIGDLASSKIRLINRGEGAGSRLLLDALLQQAKIPTTKVKNYSKQGSTHFACARDTGRSGRHRHRSACRGGIL